MMRSAMPRWEGRRSHCAARAVLLVLALAAAAACLAYLGQARVSRWRRVEGHSCPERPPGGKGRRRCSGGLGHGAWIFCFGYSPSSLSSAKERRVQKSLRRRKRKVLVQACCLKPHGRTAAPSEESQASFCIKVLALFEVQALPLPAELRAARGSLESMGVNIYLTYEGHWMVPCTASTFICMLQVSQPRECGVCVFVPLAIGHEATLHPARHAASGGGALAGRGGVLQELLKGNPGLRALDNIAHIGNSLQLGRAAWLRRSSVGRAAQCFCTVLPTAGLADGGLQGPRLQGTEQARGQPGGKAANKHRLRRPLLPPQQQAAPGWAVAAAPAAAAAAAAGRGRTMQHETGKLFSCLILCCRLAAALIWLTPVRGARFQGLPFS